MAEARELVRCQHAAATATGAASPHDVLQLRIHYPARYEGTDEQRLSGTLPPHDPPAEGYPVVLLSPGINVGPEAYAWLTTHLAATGFVAVSWSWVDDLFGGHEGLSAGLDLDAVTPNTAGTRPTSTALRPVLDRLGELTGPLSGHLDLDRVAFGGHSAGGTVALQSASPEWFPGCRAAFAYGSHTMAATALGWPEGSVVPLPHETPVLLLGGTDDGVIAASADRYRSDGGLHDPIEQTFDEAVPDTGRSALVVIDGGDHFSFTDPLDTTTGRGFLEERAERPTVQPLLARLIEAFLSRHVRADDAATARWDEALADPMIAVTRER